MPERKFTTNMQIDREPFVSRVVDPSRIHRFGEKNEFARPYYVAQMGLYVDVSNEEAAANAQLLVAAPGMLDALEAILPVLETEHPDKAAKVRTAIAAAYGREPQTTP